MTKLSKVQIIFKVVLGLFLTFAGVSHLSWARSEFLAQVPSWVPLDGDLVVILSGLVEISLGLGLVFWIQQSALVGMITALFFIAIFPGNISQYMNGISAFGLDTDTKRLIRLLFQPLLVCWALCSTGAWNEFRKKMRSSK